MAIHKKEEFTKKDQRLAEFAKALAHPARVAIVKELARQNECTCGEIVQTMPLAQSTVSQHLDELIYAGLIEGKRYGTRTCYSINTKAMEKASQELNNLFVALKKKKNAKSR